nr:hypothetical protein pmam_421 [Pithovirus mammoth]
MEGEDDNLVFILFFNGQKFRFEDKTENRIRRMMIQHIECNLQTPERFLEREGTFLKRRSNCQLEEFQSEVSCCRDLQDSGFVPRLIDSDCLLSRYYQEDISEFAEVCSSWILLEKRGSSLLDTYFEEEEKEYFRGPSCCSRILLNDEGSFLDLFPKDKIPEDVRQQVWNILIQLERRGICHCDVHPGNFLIDQGRVFIIDFEISERFTRL